MSVRLNPSFTSPLLPIEKPFVKTPPLHPIHEDTLSPSEQSPPEWTPERPLLTHPSDLPLPRSSVYRLLAETETSRNLGNEILETLSVRVSNIKEKINAITAELMVKLKEAAERAQESGFWAVLKKVASCLASALSIVFGISLLASGGGALVGGAMIASGILSLANFALSESGLWDTIAQQLSHGNEDLKKKLQMILPASVGIVAGGIGLVGTVYGVVNGALNVAEQAAAVAQAALALLDAGTTLGKGVSDGRLLWTNADVLKIQGDLTLERQHFDTTMHAIKESITDFKGVENKTRKAIEMISQMNHRLASQV